MNTQACSLLGARAAMSSRGRWGNKGVGLSSFRHPSIDGQGARVRHDRPVDPEPTRPTSDSERTSLRQLSGQDDTHDTLAEVIRAVPVSTGELETMTGSKSLATAGGSQGHALVLSPTWTPYDR